MMIDQLLSFYAAWLLACAIPVWLGSYLFRSILNTLDAGAPADRGVGAPTPFVVILPARPDYEPTVHLPAAA